jgi:hypothetical protein
VRLTYCNPPQKHIVAGGRAEEGMLFCILLRDVSWPFEDPSILAFLYQVLPPLAAYGGEALSSSRAYLTACSKVIARPSARAVSKASSPNQERAVAAM